MDTTYPNEAAVAFCRLVLGLGSVATATLLERTPKQAKNQWYFARAQLRTALDRI